MLIYCKDKLFFDNKIIILVKNYFEYFRENTKLNIFKTSDFVKIYRKVFIT